MSPPGCGSAAVLEPVVIGVLHHTWGQLATGQHGQGSDSSITAGTYDIGMAEGGTTGMCCPAYMKGSTVFDKRKDSSLLLSQTASANTFLILFLILIAVPHMGMLLLLLHFYA